jgi:hypothetical protein
MLKRIASTVKTVVTLVVMAGAAVAFRLSLVMDMIK